MPCQNGGTCYNINNSGTADYRCDCPTDFSGKDCDLEDTNNPCVSSQSSQCLNGGTCIKLSNSGFRCDCTSLADYFGKYCGLKASNGSTCTPGQCGTGIGATCQPLNAEPSFICTDCGKDSFGQPIFGDTCKFRNVGQCASELCVEELAEDGCTDDFTTNTYRHSIYIRTVTVWPYPILIKVSGW